MPWINLTKDVNGLCNESYTTLMKEIEHTHKNGDAPCS